MSLKSLEQRRTAHVLPAAPGPRATRPRWARRAAAAGALVAVSVVVGACGGSDGDTATAKSGDSGAPVSKDALEQGGTIQFAAAQGIPQLDPYKAAFLWEYQTGSLMWATLTRWTADEGDEAQPYMAESWEASDDLKTYTFTLRSDLVTSDGKPLTAEHVVASLERGLNPKLGYKAASYVGEPKSITAPDERTVVLELSKPSAVLPQALAQFPIAGPGVGEKGKRTFPTTGPYEIDSFVPNGKLRLVPNENWWGEKPLLDAVEVQRAQDNTAALTALRSGQLTALWGVPYADLATLSENPEITTVTSEQPNTAHYYIVDNSSPPFNKLEARQALAHAIDKTTIQETAYAGFGEIAESNAPLSSKSPFYDSSLTGYEFDLDKAKELFAQAGVEEGDTLTFWTTGGQYPEWTVAGQIIQSDLEKIGIKLTIKQNEANAWAAKVFPSPKKFPDHVVPNFGSGSGGAGSLESMSPAGYLGNWKSPEMTELLADAAAVADETERADLYKQIQEEFNSAVPGVLVLMLDTPLVISSEVGGAWIDPAGFVHLESAGYKAS